jgi:hypothetical protein
MGFANFYRHFIKNILQLAKPRTATKSEQFKGKNWRWSSLGELVFKVLNQGFIMVPA